MRAYVLAMIALVGCDAASSELGRGSALWFDDAQWRPGALPADDGGPAIASLTTTRGSVVIGAVGERIGAALAPEATAMVLTAIAGTAPSVPLDDGAWILQAGPPAADTPDLPSIDVRAGVALALRPGPLTLRAQAVDDDGRAGPPTELALVAESAPVPDGPLVFSLSWTGPADLDLHVVAPDGGEAWSGDPNTWEPPPPGTPIDPNAWRTGGLLDHDANASCARSGGPAEHVGWTAPPSDGTYVVRIDARSLCGAGVTAWAVTAYVDGMAVASATGLTLPSDTQLPHGAGAGLHALAYEFAAP